MTHLGRLDITSTLVWMERNKIDTSLKSTVQYLELHNFTTGTIEYP